MIEKRRKDKVETKLADKLIPFKFYQKYLYLNYKLKIKL